jgi:hypothetical protein
MRDQDSLVGIATDCTTGNRFPAGARNSFLLDTVKSGSDSPTTSSAVGTGLYSLVYIGAGVNLTSHLHLVPRLRKLEPCFHSPIRLHGLVLI